MPGESDSHGVPFSDHAYRVSYRDTSGYTLDGEPTPETVHFPTYRRRATGVYEQTEPWGMPPLSVGQRVHCVFNAQAFRWEALVPPSPTIRFEMTAALTCGESAAATPYWYDDAGSRVDGESITVYDANEKYSKMATGSGDTGALGVAQWMPDKSRWEIVDMQTPGDFWGTLDYDLQSHDNSQDVTVTNDLGYVSGMLGGYCIFQGNFGNTIRVYSPQIAYDTGRFAGREGDAVLCRWSMKDAIYYFADIVPNDLDWQTLDVVTRTSLSINFGAQTFVHRHYTRQIKLPPWTQIGPEVERW
jgi:hypothetical protein